MAGSLFYGWRVVATCFLISAVACSLCLFGASVYLQALTTLHRWSISEVSSAITVYYLVSASVQRLVGRGIDQWGPRPVLSVGTLAMALGVALTGRVTQPWQLYPCFVLIGIGWGCLSATGVSATVAPWFERHQGRSITLALMGSSLGAIAGVPVLLKAIDAAGVAQGLGLVALAAALLLLPMIGWILRFGGPEQLGQQRDGDAMPQTSAQLPTAQSAPLANQKNRRRLLWTIAAGFALALMTQVAFITHHVTLAANGTNCRGLVGGGRGPGGVCRATGAGTPGRPG
ncbi:MAG: MFS transporter [Quisquiliibacterium sp.]